MHDSFDFHVVVLSLFTSNTTGILGKTVKGSIVFYNANNLVFHCLTFAWKFANEADLQVLLRGHAKQFDQEKRKRNWIVELSLDRYHRYLTKNNSFKIRSPTQHDTKTFVYKHDIIKLHSWN